ncbi:MAG: ferredoxin--NADP reductase [Oceanococcaceae bacterium]
MVAIAAEDVLDVHHWTDTLFSFRTTREASLRFRNGQFVMVGLEHSGKPLLRAYSIASANHEDFLEFFSIKVPDGPLTSQLQHLRRGDKVLISRKPTGTLVPDDLRPGRRLWMLATGTGLAPFLSLIKDPEVYERFEEVVLVHGVRRIRDLAYRQMIEQDLPRHPYLGEAISQKLRYYPTVTRESFMHQGRITTLLGSGKLCRDLKLPPLNPREDRLMLCGSPQMLEDVSLLLDERCFSVSPGIGEPGDYVIERAFVQR